MREILFRGKRVIDGKWSESVCPLGEMHSGTVLADFVLDTVGQYVGIDDKSGKQAFEGDVVFDSFENHYGVIAYGDYANPFNSDQWTHHTGFYIDWKKGDRPDLLRKDLGYWLIEADGKIVGNIHDNPELVNT